MSRVRDLAQILGKTEAANPDNTALGTGTGDGGVDSAATISLIQTTVDSSYVQVREDNPAAADSATATLGYEFERTYQYQGTLDVDSGSQRFYFNRDADLKTILTTVGTAATGSAIIAKIKKNNSDITDTITLPAGDTTKTQSSISSFVKNDFITIDVTQVGSSTAGANLFVNMLFEKAVTEFFKTFHRNSTLTTFTGTQRFYLQSASILKNVQAYVKTAPVGASININIVKNGSTTIKSVSIADGSTSSGDNTDTINIAKDDYITVDVTQIGSTTAGTDLYVNLTFNKG